ncbi:YqaJ viral recombinase family protein [Nocardia niwae]|uniref:YqaJ viral recombinase family protein n=1 Tax=Nocardia niwae TaxID=626084 RepID=UPI0007A53A68|nr:YqaJ viral recombinase family protein [Nocardia niwae]
MNNREWLEARLTVYPDLLQGSDEWLAQRRGIVTASVIGDLIATHKLSAIDYTCPACDATANQPCRSKINAEASIKTLHPERAEVARRTNIITLATANNDTSRSLTALLVAERITGWTDPTYIGDDMLRGIEDEPRARDVYSEHYAPVQEAGFMVRERGGIRIGYSPDGLVGADGLIEIKSRRPKIHLAHILSGQPPADVMAQLQCGLLVSGRKWIDYISYCGGMPLWPVRIYPDQRWFDAIIAAVTSFETNAADMIRRYHQAVDGLPETERIIEMEMVL